MAVWEKDYLVSSFPDPDNVILAVLISDVEESDIGAGIDRDEFVINDIGLPPVPTFRAAFKASLSAAEELILDDIVANHDASKLVVGPAPVALKSIEDPNAVNTDGMLYAIPKASGYGFIMNDRDIMVTTALSGIGSYEDLRVDPTTGKRIDWGEVDLVGIYKSADTVNDPYGHYSALVPVDDQDDADLNAICTIWDYQAKSNGTLIPYEIRGGSLFVDAEMSGLGADIEEMRQHQIYAVAAPNIPQAFGGQMTFFDGYLLGYQQDWMEAQSTDAIRLDPTASSEVTRLRVYIYYPPGMKRHHILRLVCFRQAGT